MQRRRRTLEEMFKALARQVRVLDDFIEKAESDPDYLPEIAAKLRILLISSRSNKALLLELAKSVDAILTMTPTEGSDRTKHTWPEFLARATTLTKPGEKPVVVTNSDLICWWAEQAGGAHEDWEFKQSFVELAFFPARVGGSGLPLGHHNLLTTAKNVSKSAHRLLSDLDSLRRIKALTEEARAGRAARRRSPAGR